jgi:hypothetical protein
VFASTVIQEPLGMSHIMAQLTLDDLSHLEPGVLEHRLRDLIRRYAQQRSPELAESVVYHIEALYLQPTSCKDPVQHCMYRRFARHWRWLAAQQGVASI